MPAWQAVGLTPREREVLQRVALGQTIAEVAVGLQLAPGTVRNHLSSVYGKLGIRSRSEAVAWAWRSGLVQP